MSEVHRYAVHLDWIPGHGQNGPVGIWNERGECHYPQATAALQAEGAQAFSDRGASHTFESWLEMREETTSAYGANWSSIDTDEPMETAIEAMVAQFLAVSHPEAALVSDTGDSLDANEIEPDSSIVPDEPSLRRIIAESWWIASELAARHPEYVVWEMHVGGGLYDCLALLLPGGTIPDVQMNRAGSLHVISNADFHLSWREVLGDPSPHGSVKAIEEAARLALPGPRPRSTRRTLTYRFIAALLRMQIHDRHSWDVRNEFLDSSDWEEEESRGYVERFPTAAAAAKITTKLGVYGEPSSHFWAILRDEVPIAVVSVEGVLYREDGTFDLMAEYRGAGRSVARVIAKCVGDWLN
ncbi:TY-Chap2 family putative peptide chaperone [Sanguibacter suarezii]|uniref:TY-Chap2 family putative peptide chaperone n=1 Tax=Sanguibacter suarezii TaxID=60921 RepID=UPI000B1EF279|nr:hypothetical protein [Sanguibacter suarezii]